MAQLDLVYALLKEDLTAPRVMLAQVISYIQDHYSYASADVARFFVEKFPELEDYEVDLTFSPQYTPAEHNRLEYIPLLGEKALLPEEVAQLKRQLREANLSTTLKLSEEHAEIPLPVHEQFIERYVTLLKLDQKLPEGIYTELVANVPEASRNEANLLARDDVWRGDNRQEILTAFLRVFKARDNFSVPKLSFLTGFIRTYRPGNLLDLERQFDALIESCKHDMDNMAGRGFADENLKKEYAASGGAKGHNEESVWHHYRQMMEMAQLLKADYQAITEIAPDLLARAQQRQPV
ncbi:MAG TPA: hypothetical protein V6C52_13280 [Coleofasciculaceae cyanobacterium]|jgi:hypothetical protein